MDMIALHFITLICVTGVTVGLPTLKYVTERNRDLNPTTVLGGVVHRNCNSRAKGLDGQQGGDNFVLPTASVVQTSLDRRRPLQTSLDRRRPLQTSLDSRRLFREKRMVFLSPETDQRGAPVFVNRQKLQLFESGGISGGISRPSQVSVGSIFNPSSGTSNAILLPVHGTARDSPMSLRLQQLPSDRSSIGSKALSRNTLGGQNPHALQTQKSGLDWNHDASLHTRNSSPESEPNITRPLDEIQPWRKQARLLPFQVQRQLKAVFDRTGDTTEFRSLVSRAVNKYVPNASGNIFTRRLGAASGLNASNILSASGRGLLQSISEQQQEATKEQEMFQQQQRQQMLQQQRNAFNAGLSLSIASQHHTKEKANDDDAGNDSFNPMLFALLAANSLTQTNSIRSRGSNTAATVSRSPNGNQMAYPPFPIQAAVRRNPLPQVTQYNQSFKQQDSPRSGRNEQRTLPFNPFQVQSPSHGGLFQTYAVPQNPFRQFQDAIQQKEFLQNYFVLRNSSLQANDSSHLGPRTPFVQSVTTQKNSLSVSQAMNTPNTSLKVVTTSVPHSPLRPDIAMEKSNKTVPPAFPDNHATLLANGLTKLNASLSDKVNGSLLNYLSKTFQIAITNAMPGNLQSALFLKDTHDTGNMSTLSSSGLVTNQSIIDSSRKDTEKPVTPLELQSHPQLTMENIATEARNPSFIIPDYLLGPVSHADIISKIPEEIAANETLRNMFFAMMVHAKQKAMAAKSVNEAIFRTSTIPFTPQQNSRSAKSSNDPPSTTTSTIRTTMPMKVPLEPGITFTISLPESSIRNVHSPTMRDLLAPMMYASSTKTATTKSKFEHFKTVLFYTIISDRNSYIIVNKTNKHHTYYKRDNGKPTVLVEELLPGYLNGSVDLSKLYLSASSGLLPVLEFTWMLDSSTLPGTAVEAVDMVLAKYGNETIVAATLAAQLSTPSPSSNLETTITKKSNPETTTTTKKSNPETTTTSKKSNPETTTTTTKSNPETKTAVKKSNPETTTTSKKSNPETTTTTKKSNPETTTTTKKSNPETTTATKKTNSETTTTTNKTFTLVVSTKDLANIFISQNLHHSEIVIEDKTTTAPHIATRRMAISASIITPPTTKLSLPVTTSRELPLVPLVLSPPEQTTELHEYVISSRRPTTEQTAAKMLLPRDNPEFKNNSPQHISSTHVNITVSDTHFAQQDSVIHKQALPISISNLMPTPIPSFSQIVSSVVPLPAEEKQAFHTKIFRSSLFLNPFVHQFGLHAPFGQSTQDYVRYLYDTQRQNDVPSDKAMDTLTLRYGRLFGSSTSPTSRGTPPSISHPSSLNLSQDGLFKVTTANYANQLVSKTNAVETGRAAASGHVHNKLISEVKSQSRLSKGVFSAQSKEGTTSGQRTGGQFVPAADVTSKELGIQMHAHSSGKGSIETPVYNMSNAYLQSSVATQHSFMKETAMKNSSGEKTQAPSPLLQTTELVLKSTRTSRFDTLNFNDFLAWVEMNRPHSLPFKVTTTTTTSTTTTTPTTTKSSTAPPICPANYAVRCGPLRKSNRMAALCEKKCDVTLGTCDLSLCQCNCVPTVGEVSLQLAPKRLPTTIIQATTLPADGKITSTASKTTEENETEGDR